MTRYGYAGAIVILLLITITGLQAQEITPEATTQSPSLLSTSATPTPTQIQVLSTQAVPSDFVYIVQRGDTLFRIARRFGKSTQELAAANGIVNPAKIYAGQQLRIPGFSNSGTIVPPPAPPMPTPTTYTVVKGDTLARIAIRFNTTVAHLIQLNALSNPNIIYIGQRLFIPSSGSTIIPTTTPTALQTAGQGGGSALSTPLAVGEYGFGYGIQVYLVDQDINDLVSDITMLGMKWVKQDIRWRDFEPVKGNIDFATLDTIVDTLEANNLNILFTITSAPAWARTSTDEDGPPDNFADYGAFVSALAQRYAGRIHAYEIWSEPNLRREWSSAIYRIDGTSYIELLRVGYNAIKSVDPAAIVVSAGLAPTGYDDAWNASTDQFNAANDRHFLRVLYSLGLATISDAIGAHPGGWANPPDSLCCSASAGVTTHYQDPSFFFRNTINDYREIMVTNQDASTPIWITKFGWGTSEDTDSPSENYIYVSYTSLQEQAAYATRAFELGAEYGFIGPMFLFNLNGCLAQVTNAEACYYSLIGLDGSPRPVFAAVRNLTVSDIPSEPTATIEMLAPSVTPAVAETPVATLPS